MLIKEIIQTLTAFAPPAYQESYDNCGLITGAPSWLCTGVLCSLDTTEAVVLEAVQKGCNLIVAHHPIVFSGLKKINGSTYVEKTIIAAIKHDVAIYAIHTNADNIFDGVNHKIGERIGLTNMKILLPKNHLLTKLTTFVPTQHLEQVRQALFRAGAGNIGNYSEASFSAKGLGTYKANENANPFLGSKGLRHEEPEERLEVLIPNFLRQSVVSALLRAHPYEEVAYDLVPLANETALIGSGMFGQLPSPCDAIDFLGFIKEAFGLSVIRHTPLLNKPIQTVAVCGGAGSFLTSHAIREGADIFLTADVKYHEFFDAENQIILADIGHWESEQFTVDLLIDVLHAEFPTFGLHKSEVVTNPLNYFI